MGSELKSFIDDVGILYNMLSTMNEYIFIADTHTKEILISENMINEFGFKRRIIENSDLVFQEMIHNNDKSRIKKSLDRIYKNEIEYFYEDFRIKNSVGRYIWVRCKCRLYSKRDSEKKYYLAGIVESLEKNGFIDPITGIYFYDKCIDKIEHYINSYSKYGGIMVIDLDNFNHINSINNYEFGDEVLRKTIYDIKNILPDNTQIYRLYGDKFVLVYLNATNNEMKNIFNKIQKYTFEVHKINKIRYQFTISAGITMFDQNDKSIVDLIRKANMARKRAKETGKNKYEFYSEEIFKKRLKEQSLINEFRESIQNEFSGFSLVFQPICNVDTLKINGAEVLLRYNSKNYGDISPIEFIPILEECGLIIDIGKWVIDRALSICKKWVQYIPDFHVNINISLRQSIDYEFSNYVMNRLDKYELSSKNIILEITETCFIKDKKEFIEVLEHLRLNKIKIAMDDFGTGYSSLGRLQEIPIDIVKIDRSFVKSMKNKNYDYNFIKSIIGLCHNASLKVCVEGIENKDELEIINNFYADTFQGYYVSKPIPENDFFDKYIEVKNPVNSLKISKNYFSENNKAIDIDLLLLMMDSTPLCINLWNEHFENTACNQEAVKLFELRDKGEYLKRFFELSPKCQPCGRLSRELAFERIDEAFKNGKVVFKWMHCKLNGELIPCEITLVRMRYKNKYIVAGYTRDLRHQILAEKAINDNNELLNELMEATPLCLNLWSDKYENTHCNKAAVNLFNLNNKKEYLDNFFKLSPEYQADGEKSSEKARKMIDIAFDKGENKFEWMHCKLNGDLIPSEVTLKKIKIKDKYMVAGYTRDMREQINRENKIRLINSRSRVILENIPLGYIQYDINGNITDINPEMIKIVGAKNIDSIKNEIGLNNITINKYFPEFQPSGEKSIDKLSKKFIYTVKEGFSSFEFILKHSNGELIHTNMTMLYLSNENVIICFVQDLSEIKNISIINDKLKELAYFDGLTGVYNRNAFFENLDTRFKNIENKEGYPLILVDFDHFKFINDTYGHITGDKVLQKTITLIKGILPKNSIVGRYGGDEFLIQPGFILEKDLKIVINKIIREINKLKIKYQNEFINVSVSIGIAFYENQIDYKTWLQKVDDALYEVKETGRNNYKIINSRL